MSHTTDVIVKNTGYLYFKTAITMIVSLWTTRLILNSLGVVDYGIYSVIGGAIAIMGFLNASMAGATQRFMSFYQGKGDNDKSEEIFNVSLIVHTGIALIVTLVLLLTGVLFFHYVLKIPPERMQAAYVIYGSLIVSTLFSVLVVPFDAMLNAHENMRYYAIVGVVESFLKLVVAYVVVYAMSDKLIVYGVLMAFIPLISLLLMGCYCHNHYTECKFGVMRYARKESLREISGFAGWNFLGSVTAYGGNFGSGLVLNHFFGPSLNAAAGVTYQLTGMMLVMANHMTKALRPAIVKSEGAGHRREMLTLSLAGCKYSFALFAVIAIPCFIEIPVVFHVWLKNVPEWAVSFARIQIAYILMEQIAMPLATSIDAEGNISGYNIVSSIIHTIPCMVLIVLFHLGFSPIWQFVVMFIFWGVLLAITKVYFAHKNCNMSYGAYIQTVIQPVVIPFLLTILLTLVIHVSIDDDVVRPISVFSMGIITFVLSFWYFSVDKKEKNVFVCLAKGFLNKKRISKMSFGGFMRNI